MQNEETKSQNADKVLVNRVLLEDQSTKESPPSHCFLIRSKYEMSPQSSAIPAAAMAPPTTPTQAEAVGVAPAVYGAGAERADVGVVVVDLVW